MYSTLSTVQSKALFLRAFDEFNVHTVPLESIRSYVTRRGHSDTCISAANSQHTLFHFLNTQHKRAMRHRTPLTTAQYEYCTISYVLYSTVQYCELAKCTSAVLFQSIAAVEYVHEKSIIMQWAAHSKHRVPRDSCSH